MDGQLISPGIENNETGQAQQERQKKNDPFNSQQPATESAPSCQGQEQRDQRQPAPGAAQEEAFEVVPLIGREPGMPGAVVGATAGAAVEGGRGQIGVAGYALQGSGTFI